MRALYVMKMQMHRGAVGHIDRRCFLRYYPVQSV